MTGITPRGRERRRPARPRGHHLWRGDGDTRYGPWRGEAGFTEAATDWTPPNEYGEEGAALANAAEVCGDGIPAHTFTDLTGTASRSGDHPGQDEKPWGDHWLVHAGTSVGFGRRDRLGASKRVRRRWLYSIRRPPAAPHASRASRPTARGPDRGWRRRPVVSYCCVDDRDQPIGWSGDGSGLPQDKLGAPSDSPRTAQPRPRPDGLTSVAGDRHHDTRDPIWFGPPRPAVTET